MLAGFFPNSNTIILHTERKIYFNVDRIDFFMDEITFNRKTYKGYTIPTTNASLLAITAANGMLACGYVKVETADKLGDALAIVTGVNSYVDMFAKNVVAVSKAAQAKGVAVGMTGREALELLS